MSLSHRNVATHHVSTGHARGDWSVLLCVSGYFFFCSCFIFFNQLEENGEIPHHQFVFWGQNIKSTQAHTHAGITDLQHACWHLNHKTVNLEMWFFSCLTHTKASFSPLFSQAVAFQLYTHSWQYTEKVSGLFFPLKPSPDPQSTWSRTQEQHFMFF